ncbi:MAG: histidine kinase dimerization/phospho-acceptor domain-containing protein [bacterium]
MAGSRYWRATDRGSMAVITRKEADEYLHKAIAIAHETGNIDIAVTAYRELYLLQKDQHQPDKALSSLEQAYLFNDSLQKATDVNNIATLIWKHEIALHEKELQVLKLQNRQQLITIIAGVAVVFFLLVLIVVVVSSRRKLNKAYLLVNQQKDRLATLLLQLKETNTSLESINQELEAFSYSVSHDLRAPVRRIEGLCMGLQEDGTERVDEAGQEMLKHIVASTVLMNQLIEDMLKLSRITRHTVEKLPCKICWTMPGNTAARWKTRR